MAWFRSRDVETPKELARALNSSYPGRTLFNFLEYKQQGHMIRVMDQSLADEDVKKLIEVIGEQKDGTIVLSPDLILDKNGRQMTQSESEYIWIADYPTSPPIRLARSITFPVSTDPLRNYIELVMNTMANNAPQTILALAAMVGCTNYTRCIEMIGHFNTPMLTGPPMSGKTLAATCSAFIMGCSRSQIFSRSTITFLTKIFGSSTLPFVWDDPTYIADVKQITVDLGNGALRGKDGIITIPQTACLVTANFDLDEELKYSSRALQIRFEKLDKEKMPGEGSSLEDAARRASSSLPHLLSFGRVTYEEIVGEWTALRGQNLELRESEGLAYPLAVCRKMLTSLGLTEVMEEVDRYCNSASHNRVRHFPQAVTHLEAEEQLISWLAYLVSIKKVDSVVRQSGSNFYFKPKEAAAALKVGKNALKEVILSMGGEVGKNFRIPVTDEKPTRCFKVTSTPALTKAFEDREDGTDDVQGAEDMMNNQRESNDDPEDGTVIDDGQGAEATINDPIELNDEQEDATVSQVDVQDTNRANNTDAYEEEEREGRDDESEDRTDMSVDGTDDKSTTADKNDNEETEKSADCVPHQRKQKTLVNDREKRKGTKKRALPVLPRVQRRRRNDETTQKIVMVKWGKNRFYEAKIIEETDSYTKIKFLDDGKIKTIMRKDVISQIKPCTGN